MLSKVIILLVAATAALGTPLKWYGPERFPAGGKIVGGTTAGAGEFPWQVSIQSSGGSQSCGGSIISPNWILTAAHCSQIDPSRYRVVSGTLRYASGDVHNIAEVVVHNGYTGSGNNKDDIAVWRVTPAFSYGSQTKNVALPSQGTGSNPGTMMTVTGWGTTSWQGSVSEVLLKVDIPIVSKSDCDAAYAPGGIAANAICAGYDQGGKDSCQGDSGGPLVRNGVQYGVVSWGNGCAWAGYPGVYAEVSAYRSWITQNTGV